MSQHTPAPSHIILAQPEHPQQLFLLFHGVGDSAQGLAPLGRFVAAHFPQAMVVSIDSPHFCDWGAGYQWYSLQGATEANRHERVAEQMPRFIALVQAWQQRVGLPPDRTCILGFSQGAFMALQSTQQAEFLAGRIIAMAGRFTQPPKPAPYPTVIHLLHGADDGVVLAQHSVAAAQALQDQGADVTLDVVPDLAHGIDQAMADALIHRLTHYVPQRMWAEALRSAGASDTPKA